LIEIRIVKEIIPRRFHKYLKDICTKKEENISIVKNREGRDTRVCKESAKKKVYLTIKITMDIISVL